MTLRPLAYVRAMQWGRLPEDLESWRFCRGLSELPRLHDQQFCRDLSVLRLLQQGDSAQYVSARHLEMAERGRT